MDVQLAAVALGEVRERRLVPATAAGSIAAVMEPGTSTSWTSQPLPSGSLTDRNEP